MFVEIIIGNKLINVKSVEIKTESVDKACPETAIILIPANSNTIPLGAAFNKNIYGDCNRQQLFGFNPLQS